MKNFVASVDFINIPWNILMIEIFHNIVNLFREYPVLLHVGKAH